MAKGLCHSCYSKDYQSTHIKPPSGFVPKCKMERYATYNNKRKWCREVKIPFDLTIEFVQEFYNRKTCHYCGRAVEEVQMDRKAPSVGYVKTNVVQCCSHCNRFKSNLVSYKEMSHLLTELAMQRGCLLENVWDNPPPEMI